MSKRLSVQSDKTYTSDKSCQCEKGIMVINGREYRYAYVCEKHRAKEGGK